MYSEGTPARWRGKVETAAVLHPHCTPHNPLTPQQVLPGGDPGARQAAQGSRDLGLNPSMSPTLWETPLGLNFPTQSMGMSGIVGNSVLPMIWPKVPAVRSGEVTKVSLTPRFTRTA